MKQFYFSTQCLTLVVSSLIFSIASAQQYDITVYDIKNGTNTKITNGSGGSKYNAAWSNNGKQIAYDLVGSAAQPFDQSIFITDLQRGTTNLLVGAEGGNDPAWSPDGSTIAFDDWNNYPQSIYTVPSAGGFRTLVRSNAHHASWNPAGNKIAFDDNYGYIASKDIYTGAETFITYYGDRPSWSPNGTRIY